MMPIIYKLITKLLAVRFSPHNASIINSQQIGFIPDTHILENISLAWMTHDLVIHFNIPTLFFKLDFEKAFDRVEHKYIWVVLTKVGLGGTFLQLVKGLLARATSKVHVKGHFTQEIPITQGVRHRCPLSPLIFTLSTQPLMEYLEANLAIGEMDGI